MENGKSFAPEEKSALKSKTIVFNFISGLVVLWPIVAPHIGFNISLTPEQINVLAVAICAANIWLRKVTKQAVYWIKKNVEAV